VRVNNREERESELGDVVSVISLFGPKNERQAKKRKNSKGGISEEGGADGKRRTVCRCEVRRGSGVGRKTGGQGLDACGWDAPLALLFLALGNLTPLDTVLGRCSSASVVIIIFNLVWTASI
jgi:hypothetical protein